MAAHLDRINRVNPSINAIVAKLDDDRLPWARAWDDHEVVDLALGRLRIKRFHRNRHAPLRSILGPESDGSASEAWVAEQAASP
jgi:hypothetical protein